MFVLLMSDTELCVFYIILVVLLLAYWKNQVRCTLVAHGYLGLFSFFFSSRRTARPCLLACVNTTEDEPLEVWGKIQFIIHLPP